MYRGCIYVQWMSQLLAYRKDTKTGKLFNELEFMRGFCFVEYHLMKIYIRFVLCIASRLSHSAFNIQVIPPGDCVI